MSNSTTDGGGALGASAIPELLEPAPTAQPKQPEPQIFDERDRIVILTPCYDWSETTIYSDAIALCKQFPTARFRLADGTVQLLPVVAASLKLPNDSHIDRARNSLLWSFEQTHYRMGLWMDGDQPPEPEHIGRFWQHLMRGVKIVTGLVALKDIVPTFVCNTLKGERPDPQTGLFRIKDGGTGAMAFRRDLLDDLRTKWPAHVRAKLSQAIGEQRDPHAVERAIHAMAKLGYSADIAFKANANTQAAGRTVNAYFSSGVTYRDGCGDWLSEDWMICHRCWQLGIPVYADANIKIRHLGKMLFPPPAESIIEAALAVTSGANPPFSRELAGVVATAARALLADITDKSISVLHATRGRPEKAKEVRAAFFNRASRNAKIEYIFAVDEDDKESREALKSFRQVVVPPAGGIVRAINAAAKEATGKVLIMAADDCLPPPDWDVGVIESFGVELHEPRVLMTSDGHSKQFLIPHPVITRAFYSAQGYFFCPDYPHLFCDTELTVRAAESNQIIDARHLIFDHQHPMFTGATPDALHTERNSPAAWETGKAIFNRRNPKHAQP